MCLVSEIADGIRNVRPYIAKMGKPPHHPMLNIAQKNAATAPMNPAI